MAETSLLTEDQYFKLWEKHNPESQPFNEIQEDLQCFGAAFGLIAIVAAGFCILGYVEEWVRLMIICLIGFVIVLLFLAWDLKVKRRRFNLWAQRYPYDPEREFSEEHFKQKN